MSLPPERISIKRRRQEEPVETLYLEHGNSNGPEKKRRVTDFYFQRLRNDAITPNSRHDRAPSQGLWSEPIAPGIPPIRLTSLEKPRNGSQGPHDKINAVEKEKPETPFSSITNVSSKSAPTTPAGPQTVEKTRRFHLARHLSSVLSPNAAGGIRKPKSFIRPPLATFIERHGAPVDQDRNPLHWSKPVDRMLQVPTEGGLGGSNVENGAEPTLEILQASQRHPTATFVPARPKAAKMDDVEADQLADELAAFAMECDPELKQKVEAERQEVPPAALEDVVMARHDQEEYIYETYVRVPYDGMPDSVTGTPSNYGVLVIDEEDEDLWQKYVQSEEDSDWDEEDSNAEDNPANDYPEDEVSSDDEHGYNPYKHRVFGSDNEELDDERYD